MKLAIADAFLHLWPQWAACLTVTILSVSFGLAIGWTSPYLAILTNEQALFGVTEEEASWVASLLPFGRLFGAVAGSLLMEYYGSKRSLLVTGIPVMIGWICIIFADSAAWLYVSRICSGVSFGMFYSCFSIYIGEIASVGIRGALVSMVVNGMPFGMLIGNIMGSQISMMTFGLASLALNVCYVSIFPLLPPSPHYHVRMKNTAEARRTIGWYDRRADADAELEVIEKFVRASEAASFREKLDQITDRKNRRVFSLIILLFMFMQLSGLNTVTFYMEIIVRKARVSTIEPATVVIVCNAFGIAVGWISVYLIDRCGRKILIITSCGFVIGGMMLLGLHFMLLEQNFDPKQLEWLPILAMMLFTMMSIGLVPVPSTILSELFPDDLKSIAGFTASVTSAIFAFICSKTYQPMIDLMTEKYVFWFYGLVMISCMIYATLVMPETKGKTLQEIQEMLARQSKKTKRSTELTGTHRY